VHARQAIRKDMDTCEMPIEDMRTPDAFDETQPQQHGRVRHKPDRVLDEFRCEPIGRIRNDTKAPIGCSVF
jgi:hypothetical protein